MQQLTTVRVWRVISWLLLAAPLAFHTLDNSLSKANKVAICRYACTSEGERWILAAAGSPARCYAR